jgi:hypothetical protein
MHRKLYKMIIKTKDCDKYIVYQFLKNINDYILCTFYLVNYHYVVCVNHYLIVTRN